MAFRRDKKRSVQWQQWLTKHRESHVAIGLPDFVYTDERRWTCFLQEGGIDWETKWRVEMLAPNQAGHLRSFILTEYGQDQHRYCVLALELVERGTPPEGPKS